MVVREQNVKLKASILVMFALLINWLLKPRFKKKTFLLYFLFKLEHRVNNFQNHPTKMKWVEIDS